MTIRITRLAARMLLSAVATHAGAHAGVAEALPGGGSTSPALDFWRVLGPLVAGSYTGTCTNLRERRKAPATITIGADGIVSNGALQADFKKANLATLSHYRSDTGKYETSIDLSTGDSTQAQLRLATSQTGTDNSTIFSSDEMQLLCRHAGALPALAAAAPGQAVAPLIDTKKGTMACSQDGKTAPTTLQVRLADGMLFYGARSINLMAPISESATFMRSGRDLTMHYALKDGSTVTAGYNGAGTLAFLMVMHEQRILQICAVKP
jgi:hypothetical protein